MANLPSAHHAGPRFRPGRILATPGALDALSRTNTSFITLLTRHLRGDWGNLCDDDRRENELSLEAGLRLLSSYRLPDGNTVPSAPSRPLQRRRSQRSR